MAKKSARQNARQFVMQVLYAWDLSKESIVDIEKNWDQQWEQSEPLDRGYAHRLLLDIPVHMEAIEAQILPHADRGLEEMTPIERVILYVGAYELLYQLSVPYRVVLNECVNLSKEFGAEDGYKFVNRVLQGVANTCRQEDRFGS